MLSSTIFQPHVIAWLVWLAIGKLLLIGAYTIWARHPVTAAYRTFPDGVITPEQSHREWRCAWLVMTDAAVLTAMLQLGLLRLGGDGLVSILKTIIVMAVWVEIWFYVSHVWLHATKLGWRMHQHHHLSVIVQPISATSFSFAEKFFIYSLGWLCVPAALSHVMPLSIVGIGIFYTYYFLTSPIAHSNVEPMPAWVTRLPLLGKAIAKGSGHQLHHVHNRINLGANTTVLDRLFGTYLDPETTLQSRGSAAPAIHHVPASQGSHIG
jgi:sterol desaturase/sphingolipid hydroxylase (fatty acid hydroxylase superfamily)